VKYLQNHDRLPSNHLHNPLITVRTVTISTRASSDFTDEISQIFSCPFFPINTSFSGTPSPSCHSTAQNPLSWRRHYLRTPRTSTKAFLHQPLSLRSSSLRGDGHQLRCSLGQLTTLSTTLLLYPCLSAIHLTEYSFFFLFFFLSSKTSRIWPIRSLFPPNNRISSVLVR